MRISDWSSDVCSSDLLRPVDVKFYRQYEIEIGGAQLRRRRRQRARPRDQCQRLAIQRRIGLTRGDVLRQYVAVPRNADPHRNSVLLSAQQRSCGIPLQAIEMRKNLRFPAALRILDRRAIEARAR